MQQHSSHDSETPAQGQQVITACAFIHAIIDNEHKVFLAKRADTKKFLPGTYELPGGHVDFGEDLRIALNREIQEELNMNINIGDPFAAFTYENQIKGSHSVEIIYFAQFSTPLHQIKLNIQDHSHYVWVSQQELGKLNLDDHDPETKAIKRGFEILYGGGLNLS